MPNLLTNITSPGINVFSIEFEGTIKMSKTRVLIKIAATKRPKKMNA
jgi:hypothetical protein